MLALLLALLGAGVAALPIPPSQVWVEDLGPNTATISWSGASGDAPGEVSNAALSGYVVTRFSGDCSTTSVDSYVETCETTPVSSDLGNAECCGNLFSQLAVGNKCAGYVDDWVWQDGASQLRLRPGERRLELSNSWSTSVMAQFEDQVFIRYVKATLNDADENPAEGDFGYSESSSPDAEFTTNNTFAYSATAGTAKTELNGVVAENGWFEYHITKSQDRVSSLMLDELDFFGCKASANDHETVASTSTFGSYNVTGLDPSSTYTLAVRTQRTKNTAHARSDQFAFVTFATPSGAPENFDSAPVRKDGNATSITLGWTAPESHSPITLYTVAGSSDQGDSQWTTSSTQYTITGLSTGSEWTFSVMATSALGSTDKSATLTVHIYGVPSAPSAPVESGAATTSSVSLSWGAPTSDGGADIDSYLVSDSSANVTATAISTSLTVTGLTTGVSYFWTVAAVNSIGTGPASSASAAIVPRAAPDSPGAPVLTSYTASTLNFNWTVPNDNGAQITEYVISTLGAKVAIATVSGTPPNNFASYTGATGDTLSLQVLAYNSVGGSAASSATDMTPRGAPATPSAPTLASFTISTLTWTWTAPADNGAAVTEYNTILMDGAYEQLVTSTTSDTNVTFTGLTAGTDYILRLSAVNAEGPSSSVASSTAQPKGPPDTPGNFSVSALTASTVTLTWTEPLDNGIALSKYVLTVNSQGGQSVYNVNPTLLSREAAVTSGVVYNVSIHAQNNLLENSPESDHLTIAPVATPEVPGSVAIDSFNESSVTLSWAAAGDNGNEVTRYDVRWGADPYTELTDQVATELSTTVSGLTAGVTYGFRVRAVNSVGTGDFNAPKLEQVPSGAPGQPVNVTVTYTATTVTVDWAPVFDNGAAISSFTVSELLHGSTGSTSQGPLTVSGSPGSSYQFAVYAENAHGTGPVSESSEVVVCRGPPASLTNAPSAVAVTGTSALISWVAPADNGAAITDYLVTSGDNAIVVNVGSDATTVDLTGLMSGTSYSFAVAAINSEGTGAVGPLLESVVPKAVPDAPGAPTITGFSANSVTASWTEPASNGALVTLYTVENNVSAAVLTVTTTTAVFDGLAAGVPVALRVRASNDVGSSAASPWSAQETPRAAPAQVGDVAIDAYTLVTVNVSWPQPAENGLPITLYEVHTTPADSPPFNTTQPFASVGGLTTGADYRFSVRAHNDFGFGLMSDPSAVVTPSNRPDRVSPAPVVDGYTQDSATVSWTAPDDKGNAITQYIIVASPGGLVANSTNTSVVFEGLQIGEAYSFTVQAVTSAGRGTASSASAVVAIGSVEVAVAANASVVTWTADSWVGTEFASINVSYGVAGWTELSDATATSLALPDPLPCAEIVVRVSYGGGALHGSSDSFVAPGVCPRHCGSTDFVDPTGESPFAVACDDDGWADVGALADEDRQQLAQWSTESWLARPSTNDSLLISGPLVQGVVAAATTHAGTALVVVVSEVSADTVILRTESGNKLLSVDLVNGQSTPSTGYMPDWAEAANVATTVAMRIDELQTALVSPPAEVNFVVDLRTDLNVSLLPLAADVEWRLDGEGGWSTDAVFSSTAEGNHSVQARAVVDWWGHDETPAEVAWRYDVTAPAAWFTLAPDALVADTEAYFGVASDDSAVTFEYCLPGAGCAATAFDAAAASAPSTAVEFSSSHVTTTTVLDVVTDLGDDSLEYSLDFDERFSLDEGVAVADGWHSLHVRASESGVSDPTPAATAVLVQVDSDDVAPQTELELVPDAVLWEGPIEFALLDVEQFEYSVNGADAWTAVQGATLSVELTEAPIGLYAYRFRAVDDAGNVDPTPALVAFQVVDTPAPETGLVCPPAFAAASPESLDSPTCDFELCYFEYSLDYGAQWSETEPVIDDSVRHVAVRAYTIDSGDVRKEDATPVVCAWQIVDSPSASLVVHPPATSTIGAPVFVVAVDGANDCVFSFAINATTPVTGNSTTGVFAPSATLDPGAYELQVDLACELAVESLRYAWVVEPSGAGIDLGSVSVGEGPQDAWVTATDAAGNTGAGANHTWVVDVSPPSWTLTWPYAATVSSPDLSGFSASDSCSEACSVSTELDGVPHSLTNVSDGNHTVTVRVFDVIGNAAAPEERWVVVDTQPPELTVTWLGVGTVEFNVSCEDPSGCFTNGSYPIEPTVDGSYTLVTEATDGIGWTTSVSTAFSVDFTAPTTVVTVPPFTLSNNPRPAIGFACSEEDCTIQTTPANVSYFEDGLHTVQGCCADAYGNVDDVCARVEFTVDTVAPSDVELFVQYVSTSEGQKAYMNGFTASDGVYLSLQDESESDLVFDASKLILTSERDGDFTACFVPSDQAGNHGSETCLDIIFDTVSPVLSANELGELAYSSDQSLERGVLQDSFVVGVVDENAASCECIAESASTHCNVTLDAATGRLDGTTLVAADSEVVLDLQLTVVCEDVRGNNGSVSLGWTVDTVAPVVDIDFTDGLLARWSSFEFPYTVTDTASATTVTCALELEGDRVAFDDDDDGNACENLSASGLDDGDYTLTVAATDSVGNVGSAKRSFSVDTAAPTLEVEAPKAAVTASAAVEIAFGCVFETCAADGGSVERTNCTYEAWLDGVVYPINATDTSAVFVAQEEGPHEATIRASDAAGNTVNGSATWTYDTGVTFSILSGPPETSNVNTVGFVVGVASTGDDLEVEYRTASDTSYTRTAVVDGEAQFNVSVGYKTGSHVLFVRLAGLEDLDDATYNWNYEHCDGPNEFETSGPNGELKCTPCPDGLSCAAPAADESQFAGYTALTGGFWLPPSTERIYECKWSDACEEGTCVDGYWGPLCAVCEDEYAATLEGSCELCDSQAATGATVGLIVVGALVVAVAATYLVKKSLETDSRARSVSTLKIMANYFLMMSILKDVDLDWGSMLNKVFSYMGVASGSGVKELQLVNCALPIDTYTQYLLLFSVIPMVLVLPGLAIMAAAGFARVRLALRGEKQPKNIIMWRVKASFLFRQAVMVLAYFAYPIVVTTALRVLHCEEVEGESYLVDDFSKRCSGSEYDFYLSLAVIVLIVVPVGVPFAIWFAMHRFTGAGGMFDDDEKRKMQFFFFFGEFRREWYWWEVTVMARKASMAAVSVLLSNAGAGWQVYAGTWILLGSFVGQIACLPHHDVLQRRLETAAQATVLASLLLGQAIALSDSSTDRQAFRNCILVLNVVVMNGLGIVLGREIVRDMSLVARARGSTAPTVELAAMRSSSPDTGLAYQSKAARASTAPAQSSVMLQNPMVTTEASGSPSPSPDSPGSFAPVRGGRPSSGRGRGGRGGRGRAARGRSNQGD